MIPLMKTALLREPETRKALAEWLISTPAQLSMGQQCARFERAFADWQGRKHAVLFNSGASANLAILQALLNLNRLIRYGSTIGFSALTWATNVMPIEQLGFRALPIDVDPCTLNVTSDHLEGHLMDMTLQALFITNALGYLPDLDRIREQCDAYDIVLIEDNCESLGSELPSGKAGNFGLAASFSFFVAHHMSTIEGGMAATDDDDLAEMLRMVRANGWDRNLTAAQQRKWRARYSVENEFEAKYTFYVPAYNMRPTEITGFLGLRQLEYLEDNINARAAYFEALEAVARTNPDFEILQHDHMTRLSPFCFPVVCKTPELREQYVRRFGGAGVEIRPVIAGNVTRHPFYGDNDTSLPGADRVSACGFYFGIYPDLTSVDMEVLKSCLGGW